MDIDKEQFIQYRKDHQYEMSRKLEWESYKYPNVKWYRAIELYKETIEELLNENNTDDVYSLGGNTYTIIKEIFIEKLKAENKFC